MIVIQVVNVQLRKGASSRLTHVAYQRILDWLPTWTCLGNFQAIIAPSVDEGLLACKKLLKEELVPRWLANMAGGVKPSDFVFKVSYQEVKNNRFWMKSQYVWDTEHSIPD